ncbi:MAG: tetratricopeptide repeat protein [Chloroflexi bacterium]|nr:tetratricopeptide repeat protein [Chloroflexota bacterium]
MACLSLFLMGQMAVTLDGQPVTGFESGKVRALLAYLAIETDRTHSRETLANLLWPDQPEQAARNNLRQALANLRQAVGDHKAHPPFLEITRETVQFNQSSDHWIDAAAFSKLLGAAQKHRHRHPESCPLCARWLEQAAELYQGSFLENFYVGDSAPFEEWSLVKREKLQHLALGTFFHLAAANERDGDYERAYQYASRQLELDPWREEAYLQAMRAQAFQGHRNAALALYDTCRSLLKAELGVEPTVETRALYEQIRSGKLTYGQRSRQNHLANLPEPGTPFIDRGKELEEIETLLENPACRLVTLIGQGGIGKTRLALKIAQETGRSFRDGVCYIPLAGLKSVGFLISAMASALKLTFTGAESPQKQLFDYLRPKDVLLVLDSFEHLLDATPLLAEILHQTSGVVLLVTSRQRLSLQSEWLYDLEGLDYPVKVLDRDPLTYAAIALFVQRAHQAQRHFSLSPVDVGPVVRICQIVEGMPLGIELAAAAVRSRSCAAIADEMSTNLLALKTTLRDLPERHRSLWAAFEYSWQLLSETGQTVFPRLSVFRGGFQAQAAVEVAALTPPELASLVDQSLLRQFEIRNQPDLPRDATPRYDLNALVRQYAHQKLSEQGDVEATRDRHLDCFLTLAEEAEAHLYAAEQDGWLELLERDHDNLRAALGWALESQNITAATRLAGALARFWGMRGYLDEGRRWMEQVFALFSSQKESTDPNIKAKALLGAGALAWRQGDLEPAKALMEESLALFRQAGNHGETNRVRHSLATVVSTQGDDTRAAALLGECLAYDREIENLQGIAFDLGTLGDIAYQGGDYPQAQAYYEASLALHRKREDKQSIAICLNNLGEVARYLGDDALSATYVEEALALLRELGARQVLAISLVNLGDLMQMKNQYNQAGKLYCEALSIQHELGVNADIAGTFASFATLAFKMGKFDRAARLFASAEALREGAKITLTTIQAEELATSMAALRIQLGEAGFASPWEMGRGMDIEQAVSFALTEEGND